MAMIPVQFDFNFKSFKHLVKYFYTLFSFKTNLFILFISQHIYFKKRELKSQPCSLLSVAHYSINF